MAPDQRSDHELLLQLVDGQKTTNEFIRASSAAMWGKQDDSNDIGVVGRMKVIEDNAQDNEKRIKENDIRIKAIEIFIASLQPWLKGLIFLGATLTASIIGLIWALITGALILGTP